MTLIHHGMSAEDYHAQEALSASGSGKILPPNTPAHYRASRDEPDEETKAKAKGTAGHAAILQPEEFKSLYVCGPSGNKTLKPVKDAWKKCREDNPGKIIIRGEEWADLMCIREAVWNHPIASKLLGCDGDCEASFFWTEAVGDLPCPMKARIDYLATPLNAIVDVKLLRPGDVCPEEFPSVMYKRGYHRQGAMYRRATQAHGLNYDTYAFVVVENEPPFGVMVYELDEDAMRLGWFEMERAMEIYAQCLKAGEWPSWACEIQKVGIPEWVKRRSA